MVYEVTATRRRPQRFEDMIGQEFVVSTLQKSISAGKIAHAYLFSGPRGCGKTSSARILAKALNCDIGPGATPCCVCPACVDITKGSNLDVIEIDGASNTSVNDIRQIKEEVQFPPNSCRYKVYIIDEVHMLSTSAFNALLKTIEEPPPYVIFIFATTELHKVPATIKSRCQQFNFRLVSVEQLKNVLSDTSREIGIEADDEALFWISREATGSVRDAYTLFDQIAAFSDGLITFEKIRDKLGLVGIEQINRIMEACAERNSHEAFLLLDEILQNGVSIEQFIVDTADYFRNLLFLQNGINKESLLGQNSERFSRLLISLWDPLKIERALGIMLQLFRDIRYSLEPRFELELAISRLSWLSDYISSTDIKTAIVRVQSALKRDSSKSGENESIIEYKSKQEKKEITEEKIIESTISEDTEERPIDNPFAAIKQRINGFPSKISSEIVDSPPRPESSSEPVLEKINQDKQIPSPTCVPVEKLKDALTGFFQSSKNMIATSLQNSFNWIESGQTIRFSVDKPFIHNFLEQEHKLLVDTISQFIGRPTGIEIMLEVSQKDNLSIEKTKIPSQVEMVRQMFKGSIVGE